MKNFKLINTSIVILAALLFAATGCSKSSEKAAAPLELISGDLFSDRPTNVPTVAVLIKLKTPSLIESGSLDESGKLIVNKDVLTALVEEQDKTLKELKTLSEEIKLLFSYKFTVNALALAVPLGLYDQVGELGTIAQIEGETLFDRPVINNAFVKATNAAINKAIEKANEFNVTSVSHIGASEAYEMGITGKGVKVGVIDTGVDFTHKMLGGNGDPNAFKEMNKEEASPLFPNEKVVGGYDFTGPDYSPGSILPQWRIPRPDVNPMDEGGHGTHVAGSVAGLGDGVNTYDGVAPDADIYALKVFGNNGGTSDTVVIAAMEWAMDPNGDLDPSDRLDVLNLSLGGSFGKPYILYSLAVKNLAKAGVITTISAGNSGPTPYIVGAPGTAEESISVGASVDGMPKNWQFPSVAFVTPEGTELLSQRVEGAFTTPISDAPVKGKLVFVGEAAADFDQDTINALKGNIAFIDRGSVSFVEKINRAEAAGAIGALVANNKPGDAFIMGGDGSANIPGVMIDLDMGTTLKAALEKGDVIMNFASEKMIETPELIDTLTTFSSQGPRSEDALLKPEIVGPGYQIISASMGSGDKGVALNGTSMSAPHLAGVMALLKQKYPTYTTAQHKALLMNSAKIMKDEKDSNYSVTRQGAGLVDIGAALKSEILATPSSISFGEFQLESTKTLKKRITITNNSDSERSFVLNFLGEENIQVEQQTFTVPAKSEKEVSFKVKLTTDGSKPLEFHEGFIVINEGSKKMASIPVLGVSKRLSRISAKELNVFASHAEDSYDALTELVLTNRSANSGDVEIFNLIGEDDRKPFPNQDALILSRSCDLQAAGYRIVEREGKQILQVGLKLFSAVSNWQACEMSILVDSDEDGKADQEIGGLPQNYLSGLSAVVPAGFYSVLLDFDKAVLIREAFDQATIATDGKPEGELTFVPAILDIQTMKTYANSHLAVMEMDISALNKTKEGLLNMKFTVFSEGGVEYEDGLQSKWFKLSPQEEEQSYRSIPDGLKLESLEDKTVELLKGFGNEPLMIVAPFNYQIGNTRTGRGNGLQLIEPQF